MQTDRRNLLALIALPLVLFFDVLFLGRGFFKGDLFIYHFPMKKVVRDLLLSGSLPHWNPAYQAGQPLAANPAYELFYPPQWLTLLPSYPFGFQLHIVVHFAIAAVGMYLLLRSLELRAPASMFGAVSFAFGAPYLSLLIRLPFLFAMTWVPLVLLYARRAVLDGRRRDVALGAIFFGMQALLGEPVTVFQTGALAGSYALYHAIRQRREEGAPAKSAARSIALVLLLLLGGLAIAAVQLVPAVGHAGDSVRAEGFRWVYASNWSTPPVRLAEIAWPRAFRALAAADGSQAIRSMYPYRVEPFISEIYLGLLLAVAAIAGLLRGMPGRWYVVTVLAVALVLAFGDHAPLFQMLHDSGLTKSIRYPEKFLLSALFVLIVWGSTAIDRIATDEKLRRTAIAVAGVWLAASLVAWLAIDPPAAAAGIHGEAKALGWNGYWGWNLARGVAVLALLLTASKGAKWWAPAIIFFALADSGFMHRADAARAPREWFEEPRAAKSVTDRDSGRLFHQAAWDEWEGSPVAASHFANAATDRVMRDAMFPFIPAAYGFRGVLEQDLDQTSLLVTAEVEKVAQEVRQRTRNWHPWLLESANVRWVAGFLSTSETAATGSPIELRDIGPHPRYWFAGRLLPGKEAFEVAERLVRGDVATGDAFVAEPPFAPAPARVIATRETASELTVDAESKGNAFLVVANTFHKYWSATIDGKPVPIVRTNIGYQGIVVPAGAHVVTLRYRNPLIGPSLAISLVMLAIALAVAFLPPLRRARSE